MSEQNKKKETVKLTGLEFSHLMVNANSQLHKDIKFSDDSVVEISQDMYNDIMVKKKDNELEMKEKNRRAKKIYYNCNKIGLHRDELLIYDVEDLKIAGNLVKYIDMLKTQNHELYELIMNKKAGLNL